MSVSYGRGAAKKAAMLHSKIIRGRVGYCEFPGCGTDQNLQCAHIVRRNYAWTRTSLDNGWCLCAKHHFQVDKNPDEFMELVEQTIGLPAFLALKLKAVQGVRVKFDWDAELERLAGVWNDMEEAA